MMSLQRKDYIERYSRQMKWQVRSPQAGMKLMYFRSREEACVTREDRVKERKIGDEVREVLGRGQTREEFKFIISAVVVYRGLPGD